MAECRYKAIDIFSGCGGVSCGLTLVGFEIKAAVEIAKSAVETYKNYPPLSKVNILQRDICDLSGEEILKAANIKKDEIYLLAGCPPCQNFSRQNPNNKNKAVNERKKLLMEFLRIIQEIKPPFILMENVPGITYKQNKEILSEFLKVLGENYYIADGILNAADYGVPQIRKRYVLHAVRLDIHNELVECGFTLTLPKPTHDRSARNGLLPWKTVKQAIGDLPPIKAGETYSGNLKIYNHKCKRLSEINLKRIRLIRQNGGSRFGLPDELVLECHKKKDAEGKIFTGRRDVYGIMDPDKPAPTLTGGCLCYTKGRFGHYEQNRAISIREAARLQTFPDDFIFSDSFTTAGLQIGNAVPVELVKASGRVFKDAISIIESKESTRNRTNHISV